MRGRVGGVRPPSRVRPPSVTGIVAERFVYFQSRLTTLLKPESRDYTSLHSFVTTFVNTAFFQEALSDQISDQIMGGTKNRASLLAQCALYLKDVTGETGKSEQLKKLQIVVIALKAVSVSIYGAICGDRKLTETEEVLNKIERAIEQSLARVAIPRRTLGSTGDTIGSTGDTTRVTVTPFPHSTSQFSPGRARLLPSISSPAASPATSSESSSMVVVGRAQSAVRRDARTQVSDQSEQAARVALAERRRQGAEWRMLVAAKEAAVALKKGRKSKSIRNERIEAEPLLLALKALHGQMSGISGFKEGKVDELFEAIRSAIKIKAGDVKGVEGGLEGLKARYQGAKKAGDIKITRCREDFAIIGCNVVSRLLGQGDKGDNVLAQEDRDELSRKSLSNSGLKSLIGTGIFGVRFHAAPKRSAITAAASQRAADAAKKAAEAKRASDEAEAKKAAEAKRASDEAEAKKAAEAKRASDEAEAKKAAEAKRASDEAEAKKAAEAKRASDEAEAKKAAEAKRASDEAEAKKAAEAK